jgi:hypothetical protein
MELNIDLLSNKKFKFKWESPVNNTMVEVTLPNLSKLKYTVWGDWGPVYNFKLTPTEVIKIKYDKKVVRSKQKTLTIESPILSEERQKYPFYFIVEDSRSKFNYHIFLDRYYRLKKVRIISIRDKVNIVQGIEYKLKNEVPTYI